MTRIALQALAVFAVPCALADSARAVPEDPPPAAPAEPAVFAARRKGTGDATADAAVKAALGWLARHQDPKDAGSPGRWLLDFELRCKGAPCGGKGLYWADGGVGGTALALLAFLGAGETSTAGDHRAAVAAGLQLLFDFQDSEGCFGIRTPQTFLVGHSLATCAVAEAYWATHDPALLAPLTKGRDFLLAARNKDGGWRYAVPPDGDADSFVTSTAMLALRTVEFAGLEVPREAFDGGLAWFDKRTGETSGRVGYVRRGGSDARVAAFLHRDEVINIPVGARDLSTADVPRESIASCCVSDDMLKRYPVDRVSTATAAANALRALCRGDMASIDLGAKFVAAAPQQPTGFVDLHYALFGSLLFAQTGGGVDWRKAAVATLVAAQCPSTAGCSAGSWDPAIDPWGGVGGRVYATAMAALALEAPTRFAKVWDPKAKKPAPPKKK